MKQKYVVHKTNLLNEDGEKVFHGEVIELEAKLAKKFNKLGFIRPYIPDEDVDEDDDDDDEDEEASEPARPNRRAAKPDTSEIQSEGGAGKL